MSKLTLVHSLVWLAILIAGMQSMKIKVYVTTANVKFAGTDSKVYLIIFGNKGQTRQKHLGHFWTNEFERGKTDTFELTIKDIGTITKITIRSDGTLLKSDWLLEKVAIKTPTKTYKFPCHCWLTKGRLLQTLYPSGLPPKPPAMTTTAPTAIPTTGAPTSGSTGPTVVSITTQPTTGASSAPPSGPPTTVSTGPTVGPGTTKKPGVTSVGTKSTGSSTTGASSAPPSGPSTTVNTGPTVRPGTTKKPGPTSVGTKSTGRSTTGASSAPPSGPSTTVNTGPTVRPGTTKKPGPTSAGTKSTGRSTTGATSGPTSRASTGITKPSTSAPSGSTASTSSPRTTGASSKGTGPTIPGETSSPTNTPTSGSTSGQTTPTPTKSTTAVPTQAPAELAEDLLRYINIFRRIHGVPPVLLTKVITKEAEAEQAVPAIKGVKKNDVGKKQGIITCSLGSRKGLAQNCAVTWYSHVINYDWAEPKLNPQVSPFTQLVWKSSERVEISMAPAPDGNFTVLAVFDPPQEHQTIKENVPPLTDIYESSAEATCPDGYRQLGRYCFAYRARAVTWETAVTECAREKATLASIQTREEVELIKSILTENKASGAWLGLHDRLVEGRYTWVDGSPLPLIEWSQGEPSGNSAEDCIEQNNKYLFGGWADRKCSDRIPFFCKVALPGIITYNVTLRVEGNSSEDVVSYAKSVIMTPNALPAVQSSTDIIQRTLSRIFQGPNLVAPPVVGYPTAGLFVSVYLTVGPNADPNILQKLETYLEANNFTFQGPSEISGVRIVHIAIVKSAGGCSVSCVTSCQSTCPPSCCTHTAQQGYNYGSHYGYNAPVPQRVVQPYPMPHPMPYPMPYPAAQPYPVQPNPPVCPTSCTRAPTGYCPAYCTQTCCRRTIHRF